MARIWTAPITYKYKQVMSAALSNEQLRDNLEYLKMKPRNYSELGGVASDVPTLTTSLLAVNDLNWTCTITTVEANEEVFVYYQALVNLATGSQLLILDVLMDNTNYLSSGTPTALTNGIASILHASTSNHWGTFRKRVVVASAGTHTFKLRARVSATGCVATFVNLTTCNTFGVQVE